MSKLWTFGCSFTAEYNPIDGLYYPFENQYDKYRTYRGGTLPDVWPELLGKKLNYQTVNCAIGGSSNYTIFNQFINVSDLIKKDDILIFGWTSMLRFQSVHLKDKIQINLLPNATNYEDVGFSKNTLDEILVNRSNLVWVNEVLSWIKIINEIVKFKGCEVYYWTSDDTIFKTKDKFIDEKFIVVNDPNYDNLSMLGYLNLSIHYGNKLTARIVEETNGEIADDHMGELGHLKQCNYFYDHIIKHSKIINK
jgi:hypothetical protein